MSTPAQSTASYNHDDDEKATRRPQAKIAHFKEQNPLKIMPFLMRSHKFENVKDEPLGFDLKLVQIDLRRLDHWISTQRWQFDPIKGCQTHFIAVKSITPDSQAEALRIQPGDILVRVNEIDVSKIQRKGEMIAALSDARTKGDGQMTVTFAREKDSFSEVLLGHNVMWLPAAQPTAEERQERRRQLPTLAMATYEDCTIKDTYKDLTSRLIPMRAHDLKNGMWCLDDETGLPGTVSDLKFTKTGNGHATFTYKLRMPHSGRASSAMHSGGDHLLRPVMEKVEYLVSHMDGDDDLVCLNEDFMEIFFKLSPKREEVYANVTETIQTGQGEGKDIYVTVLEGPAKVDDTIEILQIVTEVKAVNP